MSNSDKTEHKIIILAFVFGALTVGKIILMFVPADENMLRVVIEDVISLGFIGLLYVLLNYKCSNQDNDKLYCLKHSNESNDSDAFKFTLTLLATLGTVLYTTYNYFQMNAIKELTYIIIYQLISGVQIFIILSIMYIVLKALSMGPLSNRKKNYINWISARLYLFNIVISLFLILIFVYFISIAYVIIGRHGSSLIVLIGSVFLIYFVLNYRSIISSINIPDFILIGVSIYIVIFVMWIPI